jgi:hypothetical protein
MRALAALAEALMAREGTTIRRAWARADGQGALHGVSAWASTKAVVLAPWTGDDTSHELTAVPEWLALLHLQGNVVTMDARGGQVESARRRIAQGGASGLSLQANQPGWHGDGAEVFPGLSGPHPLDAEVVLGEHAPMDGGQGRLETGQVWRTEALAG